MKKIRESYRDARNHATGDRESLVEIGKGHLLQRAARKLGSSAGRDIINTVNKMTLIQEHERQLKLDEALREARGINQDALRLMHLLSPNMDPYHGPNGNGKVGTIWHLDSEVANNTDRPMTTKGKRMIAPLNFDFNGVTQVNSLHVAVTHQDMGVVTTTIYLNPHSGELLSSPFPPGHEGPDPKIEFGSEFRLNINTEGVISVNRSKNSVSGFSEDNEVTFPSQAAAAYEIKYLFDQMATGVQQQEAIEIEATRFPTA